MDSVLWVEGKDDQHTVWSLLAHHRFPEVFKVIDREGIDNLLEALPIQLVKGSGVVRIGIVVDADADLAIRWTVIRQILLRSGYLDVPERPDRGGTILREEGMPVFGAWVMPDNTAPGMLEDFTASLVPQGDFLWTYAAGVLDGIPDEHRRFPAQHRAKAHIRTWLAWQEEPGAPMGQAITKRSLDASAPQAQRFVAWLRRLMIDDPPS